VERGPDIGQQFIEMICGMGRQAMEDIVGVGEGIDVARLAGPFHRPDANRLSRCARRSDNTEAPSVVASGRLAVGSALMLPHLFATERL
jgi:hypothetical protein